MEGSGAVQPPQLFHVSLLQLPQPLVGLSSGDGCWWLRGSRLVVDSQTWGSLSLWCVPAGWGCGVLGEQVPGIRRHLALGAQPGGAAELPFLPACRRAHCTVCVTQRQGVSCWVSWCCDSCSPRHLLPPNCAFIEMSLDCLGIH